MRIRGHKITPRELRVWTCIAMGKTRKEMALELGYTEQAAASAARPLYWKIGARCVADATRLAIQHRVIHVEVMAPTEAVPQ